jgi:hypothetical protein
VDFALEVHRRATDDENLRERKEVNADGVIGKGKQMDEWTERTGNEEGQWRINKARERPELPRSKKLPDGRSWESAKLGAIGEP